MILEGILTTMGEGGRVNIAPMGPIVDETMQRLVLRPFKTSTSYQNLKRMGRGVFHVTDDVELIARAAVERLEPLPELVPGPGGERLVLANACRWYALRVTSIDDQADRTQIVTEVTEHARLRDFFGFNRGKHAVLEAAILATRIGLIPHDEITAQFAGLAVLVQKTGGEAEHRAFAFLHDYVQRNAAAATANP